jgi:pSer/pThr/pTyr-binding forkhead associated (FHA) protein
MISDQTSTISINVCPNCSYENRTGVLVCENCGRSIFDDIFNHTRLVTGTFAATRPLQSATGKLIPATGSITLRIRDAQTPIKIDTSRRLILGRVNNRNPRRPDVDLTAYRAFEKGVSCNHAILHREGEYLMLSDLGSTNGTFVNGQRLTPHEPHVIKNGDQIRLGNLISTVTFNETPAG